MSCKLTCFKLLKPSSSVGTWCFNILKLCILATVYMFHMVLIIYSICFPKQHEPVGLQQRHTVSCEVWTEFLYIILKKFTHKELIKNKHNLFTIMSCCIWIKSGVQSTPCTCLKVKGLQTRCAHQAERQVQTWILTGQNNLPSIMLLKASQPVHRIDDQWPHESILWYYKIWKAFVLCKSPLCNFPQPHISSYFTSKYSPQYPILKHPSHMKL
jgi:hypothetical protein